MNINLNNLCDRLRRGEEVSREELESLGTWRVEITGWEIMPSSGPIWGISSHTLYCGDTEVASWDVEGCGCYGPNGSSPDKWGMESANHFSYIPEDIQQLLNILSLEDPALEIPEPEPPADNPDPEGEWCVYWRTCPIQDSYVVARYATEEEARAVCAAKQRGLKSRYPGNLLCGYQVRKLVDGKWIFNEE